MVKKLIEYLKRLDRVLITTINFMLIFLIYWTGVSLSFLLLKASQFKKKEKNVETYWIDYKREFEDHRRQY